ncbi:hypothetical protein [Nostoc linckia]|uniref:hypothetical protein n=1 Tax=Nostoc linckia TaxID=92942 RepID=UPI0015D4C546|nr:hypothetical protein [Nostoc linckia]
MLSVDCSLGRGWEAGSKGGNLLPCPMPNAQCPMPNAQCPIRNSPFSVKNN